MGPQVRGRKRRFFAFARLRFKALAVDDRQQNVWQWCTDWFEAEFYAKSPLDDPSGATGGQMRVYRGGPCNDSKEVCRSAFRGCAAPGDINRNPGFRVAIVLEDK